MKFSYAKIEDLCAQLKSVSADITKTLDSIKNDINTIESTWSGEASEYYIKKIRKLSTNFDDFTDELNLSTLFLEKSSDEYSTLEAKSQNEIVEKLGNSRFFNN